MITFKYIKSIHISYSQSSTNSSINIKRWVHLLHIPFVILNFEFWIWQTRACILTKYLLMQGMMAHSFGKLVTGILFHNPVQKMLLMIKSQRAKSPPDPNLCITKLFEQSKTNDIFSVDKNILRFFSLLKLLIVFDCWRDYVINNFSLGGDLHLDFLSSVISLELDCEIII